MLQFAKGIHVSTCHIPDFSCSMIHGHCCIAAKITTDLTWKFVTLMAAYITLKFFAYIAILNICKESMPRMVKEPPPPSQVLFWHFAKSKLYGLSHFWHIFYLSVYLRWACAHCLAMTWLLSLSNPMNPFCHTLICFLESSKNDITYIFYHCCCVAKTTEILWNILNLFIISIYNEVDVDHWSLSFGSNQRKKKLKIAVIVASCTLLKTEPIWRFNALVHCFFMKNTGQIQLYMYILDINCWEILHIMSLTSCAVWQFYATVKSTTKFIM